MEEEKKNSKVKIAVISIILVVFVLLLARYMTNQEFRNLIDMKFLGKQVSENNLDLIEINSEDNPAYFAFDTHIGIIAKNKLSIYNSKGQTENSFSINISNPMIDTNEKFAVVAEKNGNKFYVINSTSLLFQQKIDGKISKISVNKNGYIAIIASNSTYSSIVIVYDNDNNELFKTFSRSSYTVHACISDSNNLVAVGEVNYAGTVMKSNVKMIDIGTAKTSYEFNGPENEILTNIVFGDNDMAICSFSSSIYQVKASEARKIYDITDENPFVNIDMKNILAIIERESSGLFSYEYKLKLKSATGSGENIYFLNYGLPKRTFAKGNFIALDYGSQVAIIGKNGALKKSYVSSQQIKDLILGSHICGIVYKDKIEIISL
ncbi:MAG: hypothetical protein IJ867_05905 [Clostridia bacterium]|nr:hypothetical protein [Clostridia bacterium]